jgi:hypothetical protein
MCTGFVVGRRRGMGRAQAFAVGRGEACSQGVEGRGRGTGFCSGIRGIGFCCGEVGGVWDGICRSSLYMGWHASRRVVLNSNTCVVSWIADLLLLEVYNSTN